MVAVICSVKVESHRSALLGFEICILRCERTYKRGTKLVGRDTPRVRALELESGRKWVREVRVRDKGRRGSAKRNGSSERETLKCEAK